MPEHAEMETAVNMPSQQVLLHPAIGSTLSNWLRVLVRYGGTSWNHSFRGVAITSAVAALSPMRLAESVVVRSRISRTELHPEPVFIIGHWKSGTTLAQILLARDPQFGCVNLLHSVLPAAMWSVAPFVRGVVRRRLPDNRLADTLPVGLDEPQGDELPMAGLTDLSYYLSYFFPASSERIFRRSVLFEGVSEPQICRWQQTYLHLLRKVACVTGCQRLVLRNAANSARIPQLLELFPRAKFVFTLRNPYHIFAAVRQRWEGLLGAWALQNYRSDDYDAVTLVTFQKLVHKYLRDRALIPQGNLFELRYEDLIADPTAEIQRLYDGLGLSGFADASAKMGTAWNSLTGDLGGDQPLTSMDVDRITER